MGDSYRGHYVKKWKSNQIIDTILCPYWLFLGDTLWSTCAAPARRSRWGGQSCGPAAPPPRSAPPGCAGWADPSGDACSRAERRTSRASLPPPSPPCHPASGSQWEVEEEEEWQLLALQRKNVVLSYHYCLIKAWLDLNLPGEFWFQTVKGVNIKSHRVSAWPWSQRVNNPHPSSD